MGGQQQMQPPMQQQMQPQMGQFGGPMHQAAPAAAAPAPDPFAVFSGIQVVSPCLLFYLLRLIFFAAEAWTCEGSSIIISIIIIFIHIRRVRRRNSSSPCSSSPVEFDGRPVWLNSIWLNSIAFDPSERTIVLVKSSP
jgi:hypothetical protein